MDDEGVLINVVCLAAIEFLARFHTLLADGVVPDVELVNIVLSDLQGNQGFGADTVVSALRLVGYECALEWRSITFQSKGGRRAAERDWISLPSSWQYSELRAIIVCHGFHFSVLQLKNGKWGWYEWSADEVITDFSDAQQLRATLEKLGQIKCLIFVKQNIEQEQAIAAATELSTLTAQAFAQMGAMVMEREYDDDVEHKDSGESSGSTSTGESPCPSTSQSSSSTLTLWYL